MFAPPHGEGVQPRRCRPSAQLSAVQVCAHLYGGSRRPAPRARAPCQGLCPQSVVCASCSRVQRPHCPWALESSRLVMFTLLSSCSHDIFPPCQPAVQHHLGVLHGRRLPDHGRVQHVSCGWLWQALGTRVGCGAMALLLGSALMVSYPLIVSDGMGLSSAVSPVPMGARAW